MGATLNYLNNASSTTAMSTMFCTFLKTLYLVGPAVDCSAGSSAAVDLNLEVMCRDYGNNIANQVAQRLVMSPHSKGGQSQYVETPLLQGSSVFDALLK